jgi:hypothetical protein
MCRTVALLGVSAIPRPRYSHTTPQRRSSGSTRHVGAVSVRPTREYRRRTGRREPISNGLVGAAAGAATGLRRCDPPVRRPDGAGVHPRQSWTTGTRRPSGNEALRKTVGKAPRSAPHAEIGWPKPANNASSTIATSDPHGSDHRTESAVRSDTTSQTSDRGSDLVGQLRRTS